MENHLTRDKSNKKEAGITGGILKRIDKEEKQEVMKINIRSKIIAAVENWEFTFKTRYLQCT